MPDDNDAENTGVVDHGSAGRSPADDVVDYVESTSRRITNPDDVVGLCSECKNVIEPARMEKSIFAQTGAPPVCPFCGGVAVIVYRELIGGHMKDMFDIGRGLGKS